MAKKCPKVQKSVKKAGFLSIRAIIHTRGESWCFLYAGFKFFFFFNNSEIIIRNTPFTAYYFDDLPVITFDRETILKCW